MTAQELWAQYSAQENIQADYEAWSFGDSPDELAELLLRGTKTATASAYPFYELEGTPLPQTGAYSVILNSREEAVCIIKTTKVVVLPFRDVDQLHAWKEGEGDRSLAYWRTVHERFFRQELAQVGISFDEDMKVVCEEFVRLFP